MAWCIPEFGAEKKSALLHSFLLLSAVLRARGRFQNPRPTPVPLTQNYYLRKMILEKIFFEKLRISRVISGKTLSFPEILRVQFPSKIPRNNSQGVIFAIISCHRVRTKLQLKRLLIVTCASVVGCLAANRILESSSIINERPLRGS